MFELNTKEKEKLEEFIKENKSKYSKNIQSFIENDFTSDKFYHNDFMNQIYAYLFSKKYSESNNIYNYFIELMDSKFSNLSERKILEIASGYIPGLAIIINELYDMEHNITCMDPNTLDFNTPGIKQKKQDFSTSTDISQYDLLISHCPCDTFDDIVDKVITSPRDMCVQTCRCRSNKFYFKSEFDYYMNTQIEKLQSLEDEGYTVEVDITDMYNYTMTPVVTVLKKNYPPKVQYRKHK